MFRVPGKWEARANRIYEGEAEVAVATKADVSLRHFANETARFIAAAPELYDALEGALDSLEYVARVSPALSGYAVRAERITAARAALRKARGEE